MDYKQQILHMHRVDGLSQREVSRRLKVDRKTVSRIINAYEEAISLDSETGLDDFLAVTPQVPSPHQLPKSAYGACHQRNRQMA